MTDYKQRIKPTSRCVKWQTGGVPFLPCQTAFFSSSVLPLQEQSINAMSNFPAFNYRAGIGIVCGSAAGIIALYVLYKPQWGKRFWRKKHVDEGCSCTLHSSPQHQELKETLVQQDQVSSEHPGARNPVLFSSSSACGEETDILDRLDFVLRSIAELKQEVGELRNSLDELAVEIVGQVKSHITESQKVTRRRRFLFHRERSDSTGSSSVYFTAASGAANTDGESEGGYTTANPESDYDRESARESDEDDEDEASCETVKTVRRDSMDLVNDEETTLIFDPLKDADLAMLWHGVEQKQDGEIQDQTSGQHLLLNTSLKSLQN